MPISFNDDLKSSAEAVSSAAGRYGGGLYVLDLLSNEYAEGCFKLRNSLSAGVEADVRR